MAMEQLLEGSRRNARAQPELYTIPDKVSNYQGVMINDWNEPYRMWSEVGPQGEVYCSPHHRREGSWSEAIADLLGWTFRPVAYVYAKRVMYARARRQW